MKMNLMDPLTKEQEEETLKEIDYKREQLEADVKQLKEWLQTQAHLPPCRLKEEDSLFIWWLTESKGSLESVKRTLDAYYSIRSYSEIYDNRDPLYPPYGFARDMCCYSTMPHTNPEGVRVTIARFADLIPDKFDYLEFTKVCMYRCELYARQAGICSRMYIMFDCKGATPSIVLKMKPSVTRDCMFLLENVFQFRLIKTAFINVAPYVEVAINTLVKPFLPKKIKERFHMTSGGAEDLLNYFSPSILPSDYCGDSTNPTLAEYNEVWSKYEDEHRDWCLNELSEHVDESKRITTDNKNTNPFFGVHGSLKKLVID